VVKPLFNWMLCFICEYLRRLEAPTVGHLRPTAVIKIKQEHQQEKAFSLDSRPYNE